MINRWQSKSLTAAVVDVPPVKLADQSIPSALLAAPAAVAFHYTLPESFATLLQQLGA